MNPSREKMVGSSLFLMPSPSASSSPSRMPFPSVSGLFGAGQKNGLWGLFRSSLSAPLAGGPPPTHHARATPGMTKAHARNAAPSPIADRPSMQPPRIQVTQALQGPDRGA